MRHQRPKGLHFIRYLVCVFLSCSIGAASFASPLTLQEIVALARTNDPQFLSTAADLAAAHARASQAISQTLPQLAASATQNWNHRSYETLQSSASPFSSPTQISDYESRSGQVTLSQPIWRHGNFISVSEANLVVNQNERTLDAAEQELYVRVMQAWFDVLLASDAVSTAQRSVDAARLLMEQADRGRALDLTSAPDAEEIRAKFEAANAERIAAAGEQEIKLATLEEIVGPLEPFDTPTLSDNFPLPQISGESDLWVTAADRGPSVQAAYFALIAAQQEVRKQRAGHEATVDLVGSYGRNYQELGNFPGQEGYDIRQRSVGVQLSVPIYSGGAVHARVKEAIALKAKANQELEMATRKARSAAQSAWFGIRTARARYRAAQQAEHAAEISLRAARSGSQTGLKFELDVLDAQQKMFEARHDREAARYEIILQSLKLKATAGELHEHDVLVLDGYLNNPSPPDR